MSDKFDVDDNDRLAERKNRQNGKGGGGGNKLLGFLFILFILVASPFIVLGPQGVSDFLGLGTSCLLYTSDAADE